ncbi:hypothetical protein HAHI6034_11005 [Hathewaya histolytica]|uniref:Uncharacterized protein n=1 Tax=Hathewaya histolytica TaxID=1498 RepID=A0A4U9RAC2_HATHI|nr:hypothetical protein [Hathewaya histolytica]VTQ88582.1 Uncharacterised protein [Hathewaya histolytica]
MKSNKRIFKTIDGLELLVINRKSAVIFEIRNNHEENNFDFHLRFNSDTFKYLFEYLEEVSNKSWSNINPKEADSLGADYEEYYDRQFDNNGYLSIRKNQLQIERPVLESNKLYQFNKRKMESFLYDFRKVLMF